MLMRPKFLILIVLFSDILTSYHTFPLQLQRTHSINLQKLHSSALSSSELSPVADELIGWNSNESSYAIFLDKYWQKKPVFIRSALTQEDCTRLSKNDLIELVGNDDVESRLFKHLKGKKWDKSYGPFDPNTIDSLPSEKWSILIQEMDRHLPWVADLWSKYFNFVPLWRRDDIMFSYSSAGGGIGAHVDNYDVFLVQGSGKKEWAIENNFVSHDDEKRREVPNVQTRLLSNFKADQKWTLRAGDMLYLPPRVPHQGVCLTDDCVTISVGFRAPSYESLLTAFCAQLVESTSAKTRFLEDSSLVQDFTSRVGVGAISSSVQSHLTNSLGQYVAGTLLDKKKFGHWTGRYLTTPLRMRSYTPQPFFLRSWRDKHSVDLKSDDHSETVTQANKVIDINDNYDNDDDDDDDENSDSTKSKKLPVSVSGRHSVASTRVFNSVDDILKEFQSNKLTLRRLEGLRVASTDEVLFVDGQAFPLSTDAKDATRDSDMLLHSNELSYQQLTSKFGPISDHLIWLLGKLLSAGLWYPVDSTSISRAININSES